MTAKKKDEGTKTETPLLTEAQAGQYQRYINSHRLTGNAMTREEWLEMTEAAEKKGQRRAG